MRAVIYARYASDKQNEQSLEGQIHVCQDFAQRNVLGTVDAYTDRAVTDDRLAFQRMIMDSERRIFDAVIVYRLDRFSRNRYDSAIYRARFKKNSVEVFLPWRTSRTARRGSFSRVCWKAWPSTTRRNWAEN